MGGLGFDWGFPPPKKIVINLPGICEKLIVKERPIGSAVSKILRYKQTHRHTNILLL